MRRLPLPAFLLVLFLGLCLQPLLAQEVIDDLWAAVHMDGVKIGHAHVVITRIQEDGKTLIQMKTESKSKIVRMGQAMETEVNVSMLETEDGKPIRFTNRTKQAGMPVEHVGEVTDGKLVVVSRIMGNEQTTEIDLDPEILGPYGALSFMKEKGLEEGMTYTVKLLSPEIAKVLQIEYTVKGKGTVDVLGEERELHRLDSTIDLLPGIVLTNWVDDEADPVLDTLKIMGVTQETFWVSKEKALEEPKEEEVPDLLVQNFIRPDHPMAHPRGIRSATFRLKPKEGDLPLPVADEIQEVSERGEDGAVILKVRAPAPEGDTIPFPVADPEFAEYLQETVYLQCDDPALAAEAKKVVGEEKDAYRAAKALEKWVFVNLNKKSLDVGFASAKEVFRDRKGDCSEHGVLLAAMTRAVGIPSRVAIGIEYVYGIFGWHMWTEVWAGEWIPLDATLASPFVDATHIKFVQSSLKDPTMDKSMFQMVSLIGNLDIDVIDYVLDGPTIKPGDPELQPKIDGNRYTHPLLGISLEKPEGWTFEELEGDALLKISPAEGDFYVKVRALALSYDSSLDAILQQWEEAGEVKEKEMRRVGGHPGLKIVVSDKLQALTQPTDTLYIIELCNPPEDADRLFEKILETVEIEK